MALRISNLFCLLYTESEVQPQSSIVIDHPLAPDSTNQMTADSDSNMSSLDNLVPRDMQNNTLVLGDKTKSTQYGCCLTLSDHDRLRIFIHEFIVRGLLPWAERMLRTLNEQVTIMTLIFCVAYFQSNTNLLFFFSITLITT